MTYGNLSNNSYSSSKSIGANANFNLSGVNDKNQDVQKGISSVGYNASNSLIVNASKTLATLGQGNVIIKDKENSDEIERLNTDTSKIDIALNDYAQIYADVIWNKYRKCKNGYFKW